MGDKFKLPVLVGAVAIAFILAGGSLFLLQTERKKNLSLQEELTDVKAKYKVVEAKFEEQKRILVELDDKLTDANSLAETLKQELDKEKSAKEAAIQEAGQIKDELEKAKSSKTDLENRLKIAQDEAKKFTGQLKDLEAKKNELEVKIKDLEARNQDVQLGKIVVNPEEPAGAAMQPASASSKEMPGPAMQTKVAGGGQEGKVLVVNKEYNFAVISLGNKDGVGLGDVFSVYDKADKYIGDVKVEKVHDAMSAASFVTKNLKDFIAEEDKAVRKIE